MKIAKTKDYTGARGYILEMGVDTDFLVRGPIGSDWKFEFNIYDKFTKHTATYTLNIDELKQHWEWCDKMIKHYDEVKNYSGPLKTE